MSSINKSRLKTDGVKKIFLISICVYFVSVFCVQQFKINEYKVQEQYYNNSIAEINNEKAEYETLASKSDSTEYIEKVARDKLGLVKPYEKIFIDVNR